MAVAQYIGLQIITVQIEHIICNLALRVYIIIIQIIIKAKGILVALYD